MKKSYIKYLRKKTRKIIIALLFLSAFIAPVESKSRYTIPVSTPTPTPSPTVLESTNNQEYLLWSN